MKKQNFFLLVSIIIVLPLLAMRKAPRAITQAKKQAEQAIGVNNFAQANSIIRKLRSIRENHIANQLEIKLLKKQLVQSQAPGRAIPAAAGVSANVAALQQQNTQLQQANAKLLGSNGTLMTKLQAIKDPYEVLKNNLNALYAEFSAVLHSSKQTHPGDTGSYQEFMQKVNEVSFNEIFVANLTGVRSAMDQVNSSFGQVMAEAQQINQQFFS